MAKTNIFEKKLMGYNAKTRAQADSDNRQKYDAREKREKKINKRRNKRKEMK
jgi:hypothetical protein